MEGLDDFNKKFDAFADSLSIKKKVSESDLKELVLELIKKYKKNPVSYQDILNNVGHPESDIRKALGHLLLEGELFIPKPNYYQTTW